MQPTSSVPPSLFDRNQDPPADEREALIALEMVTGVGPGRLADLLARFGSARAIFDATTEQLRQVPGVGPQTASTVRAFDQWGAVRRQIREADALGAVFVEPGGFPSRLREIYDPPLFLWMRGSLQEADENAVAIVGTRRASARGRQLAYEMAYELARQGFTIVSGLAYGIDAAAHQGALDADGRTIAVLGSGLGCIYPRAHRDLAEAVAGSGAVLSELPIGAAPDAPNFPKRNRIVSGLSLGVLVAEAYEQGGALITARLAVEQDREVFAFPHAVESEAGVGCNRLIQRGHAKLVLDAKDILEEIGPAAPLALCDRARGPDLDALPAVERDLYEALASEPRHIDLLCEQTELDPSAAAVALLELEFRGLAQQLAGKHFVRSGPRLST